MHYPSFILKTGKEEIIEVENSDKIFEIPWVANGHPELKTKNGYPINDMPWGTLTGINLDLGKLVGRFHWGLILN